jgi:hypothetical protein
VSERIDTPTKVREWKERMLRVGQKHDLKSIPPGFDVTWPEMGESARDFADLLVHHANGAHGQHLTANHQVNGGLQEWLLAEDPVLRLVQPVPAGHGSHIIGGLHETAGLPGYPAYDFGAPAGSPVIACEPSLVERFSGHDPAEGPVDGVHGPFGWSIYLRGDSGADYFYTHLGARVVPVGTHVPIGAILGLIGDYAKWGGADHVHLGVDAPASGHPSIQDVRDAPLAS